MNNREYMAKQLTDPDWIDDGGASYLSMVEYNIACPYLCGDKRGECRDGDAYPNRDLCTDCKLKWLEQDVDE